MARCFTSVSISWWVHICSLQDLIENVVAVAENTADELARSDGRDVQLEEDPDLQLPFLLPEDGYSCDVVRNIPNGLQEFLDPLCQRGKYYLSHLSWSSSWVEVGFALALWQQAYGIVPGLLRKLCSYDSRRVSLRWKILHVQAQPHVGVLSPLTERLLSSHMVPHLSPSVESSTRFPGSEGSSPLPAS